MNAIGLDIGGANLKVSDGLHQTRSIPFPLWQQPENLPNALSDLIAPFPSHIPLGVTMTGELADCYPTRTEGVLGILQAVEQVAGQRPVGIWQTSGEFVSIEDAREFPLLSASANWHALATWAGRMAPHGPSMLIDIGSTTSDLIPLQDGIPVPVGRNDFERLGSQELIYFGVRRTPVSSLLSNVTIDGSPIGLARELFATTLDAHLWLGLIPEDEQDCRTANGSSCTKQQAAQRLARMLCSDMDDLNDSEIDALSQQIVERELELLKSAFQQVVSRSSPPEYLLLTGEGEFLARTMLQSMQSMGVNFERMERISLTQSLGKSHSEGACAFALARLAGERLGD